MEQHSAVVGGVDPAHPVPVPAGTPPQRGIVVDRVSRSFGRVHAVIEASLRAEPGRVTALVGPNGSGKTTLMLMLASLLAPDSGTITIDGHDPLTDTRAVRSRIGWMPDSLGVWPSLTVAQALQTVGRLYDLGPEEAAQRAHDLIDRVGLGRLRDQRARVLSRGQKQKLSLARALVNRPTVLLLDEPASGLDPQARIELRTIVREEADAGATVLISSHVLAELEEMADDAVYLYEGVTASEQDLQAAQAGVQPWRLAVLDPAALAPALAEIGIDAAPEGSDPREVTLWVSDDEDAARLLRELVRREVPVVSWRPAVGRLEHTFRNLNRGRQ